MPFKANAARRHRIPKQRHRVTNWAEYDASLRQRGSLTVWFSDDAIAAWRAERRTTRGGQAHYSALAIRTALALALRERARLLGSAFRSVVFAQVRISALNTALTGLYLLGIVPLTGAQLPLMKTMIAVTFLAGLLPVIGNLISNTVTPSYR
jgi:hypothetical protein